MGRNQRMYRSRRPRKLLLKMTSLSKELWPNKALATRMGVIPDDPRNPENTNGDTGVNHRRRWMRARKRPLGGLPSKGQNCRQ